MSLVTRRSDREEQSFCDRVGGMVQGSGCVTRRCSRGPASATRVFTPVGTACPSFEPGAVVGSARGTSACGMAGLGTSGRLPSQRILSESLRGRHPGLPPSGGRVSGPERAVPVTGRGHSRGTSRAAAWLFLASCHFVYEALAFDKRTSLVHGYQASSGLIIRQETRP